MLTVEQFKAEIAKRDLRRLQALTPTECCFVCGGNEWRFSSAGIWNGDLYIAVSCPACERRYPMKSVVVKAEPPQV